ncbi:hypothetical protein ACQCVH_18255 [Bacillus infantis]|uniref:hypothetical protein n=1 Tax=Bacillus infantis TaxID=324767 RepID=UPI003CE97036
MMYTSGRPVYFIRSIFCITLLGITGIYLLIRLGMIIISAAGFALIGQEGQDLQMATLVPDFLMVFVFKLASGIYFKNKSIPGMAAVFLLLIILVSILPRLMLAENYTIIESTDFAVTGFSYEIPQKEYDGVAVKVYRRVLPYVYQEGKEFRDDSILAEKSQREFIFMSYEVEEGNTLIIGELKIPLEYYGKGGES